MEDTFSHTKRQKLLPEDQIQNQAANPSKSSNNLLYKITLLLVFLVILPLFPTQAPDFINQTFLTRSWELLHLLLVGIAVSYGLFGRKNEETDNENSTSTTSSKFENAQLSVSRFLQVSSVFDDEPELESPSGMSDENKVLQTWSNQYIRDEPVVVLAREPSLVNENRGMVSSRVGDKPLLLPVRSLKSRVSDPEIVNEFSHDVSPYSLRSSSFKEDSRRFYIDSTRRGNTDVGGVEDKESENKLNEDHVLVQSPIQLRSRSGRMEMEEKDKGPPPLSYNSPPSMEDRPKITPIRSNTLSSTQRVSLSSPKKSSSSSSSSPFLSPESEAKSAEDLMRKKTFYRPPPPPPPPPPRPSVFNKPSSMKQSRENPNFESNPSVEDMMKPIKSADRIPSMGKSVRTMRAGGIGTETRNGRGRCGEHEIIAKLDKVQNPVEKEFPEQEKEGQVEKMEVEKMVMEFMEDSESEEEEEEEDTEIGESLIKEEDRGNVEEEEKEKENGRSGEGPDVDKKADEFIARFREQIRLQRIASIKKSSAQFSNTSSIKSSR